MGEERMKCHCERQSLFFFFLHMHQERWELCIEGNLKTWPEAGHVGKKEEKGPRMLCCLCRERLHGSRCQAQAGRPQNGINLGRERVNSIEHPSGNLSIRTPLPYTISKMGGLYPSYLPPLPSLHPELWVKKDFQLENTSTHEDNSVYGDMKSAHLLERELPEYDLADNFLHDQRTATRGISGL